MAINQQLSTLAQFEEFIALPENHDRLFEYMDGELYEVPSNPYSSKIGMLIAIAIGIFLKVNQITGHITGEAGGYIIAGARLAPDVAYISKARQAKLVKRGYNPNPPELAVGVISPDDKPEAVANKIKKYLEAGVLLWVVYPEQQQVEVHKSGFAVQIIGLDGSLDGATVLPGFMLPVREIFAE